VVALALARTAREVRDMSTRKTPPLSVNDSINDDGSPCPELVTFQDYLKRIRDGGGSD